MLGVKTFFVFGFSLADSEEDFFPLCIPLAFPTILSHLRELPCLPEDHKMSLKCSAGVREGLHSSVVCKNIPAQPRLCKTTKSLGKACTTWSNPYCAGPGMCSLPLTLPASCRIWGPCLKTNAEMCQGAGLHQPHVHPPPGHTQCPNHPRLPGFSRWSSQEARASLSLLAALSQNQFHFLPLSAVLRASKGQAEQQAVLRGVGGPAASL